MLIEVTDNQIELLFKCRNTDKRAFREWNLKGLLNEAIYEFHQKYYKKQEEIN